MYHISFIHSSVEGHLGCVQVLAIMNNAAKDMEILKAWYHEWLFGVASECGVSIMWFPGVSKAKTCCSLLQGKSMEVFH